MNKAEGKRDGGAGALVQSAGQAYTARARLPPSVLVAHAPPPVFRRDYCARHRHRRPSSSSRESAGRRVSGGA